MASSTPARTTAAFVSRARPSRSRSASSSRSRGSSASSSRPACRRRRRMRSISAPSRSSRLAPEGSDDQSSWPLAMSASRCWSGVNGTHSRPMRRVARPAAFEHVPTPSGTLTTIRRRPRSMYSVTKHVRLGRVRSKIPLRIASAVYTGGMSTRAASPASLSSTPNTMSPPRAIRETHRGVGQQDKRLLDVASRPLELKAVGLEVAAPGAHQHACQCRVDRRHAHKLHAN